MGLSVVFLLAGLGVIGWSVREIALVQRLRREGVRTEGVVVRHRGESAKEGPVTFAVVGFVDLHGLRHEVRAGSSGVRGLPVGGPALVVYLPGVKGSARVDVPSKRRVGLQSLVAGGVFLAVGVMLLLDR
ncbi:DUF3592 domain-containing protein [Streptomyces sp. NPDC059740]|uniref:DUF3592 domain-containing protein n=1 Tax=Streptomyces sp. NPDC059740 TaxID=3346926 RepID=UPI0036636135